ncbi:hypothetical protein WG219_11370 [Ectopseudomonas mendocina]|uniref:Uncharacterized protein n=1 Tax=Ectopseudomonas mendocina TaxID=300 RepID=A0ABZ2RAB1_ECTME
MNADIQIRDPLRNELAAKMAEFEAKRGPVVTMPIVQRCDKHSYNNRIVTDSRAARRGNEAAPSQMPLAKRGTRQARQRAMLREVWK